MNETAYFQEKTNSVLEPTRSSFSVCFGSRAITINKDDSSTRLHFLFSHCSAIFFLWEIKSFDLISVGVSV